MHRSRLEMENKELDFHFEIVNVQFNELGRYVLRLAVENPLLEGSAAGVRLLVNGGGALYTNRTTTDVVAQTGLGEIHTVARRKFLFRLPKGYCQNDENHDVRLRIEAFRVTDSSLKGAQKAGEAFFAIYPRTDAPRINVLAKEDEDFYCYSSIMTLLRVQDDALSMHCGRMAYKVRFHETRPPRDVLLADSTPPVSTDQGQIQPISPSLPLAMIRKSTPPPTVLKQQIPSPSPIPENEPKEGTQLEPLLKAPEESPSPTLVVDHLAYQRQSSNSSLHLSPLEHIPAGSFGTHPRARVLESPPGKTEPTLTSPTDEWHVSRPGKQSITIILHGATDLPALSDGSVPQPFGTVKSGMDEEENQRAQGVTHATAHPTHSPSWEEKVTVEIEEEVAKEEVVIVSIADSRSKELLASYCLPVLHLQMFHHYHLELVQPHPSIPSGIRLYVTVVRKGSVIPRQEGFAFTGFEVLLRAVECPLKDPSGPLLAVARIVPDYESYKSKMLMKSPRLAGISVTTVEYPRPKQSSLDVPHHTSQGYPQVSHAGFPQEQPVWDHSFLFQGRDCATIFTVGAALIIEYYCVSLVMNTVSWFNRSPVGFSGVPLGQDVYHRLMTENGGLGLRVDGLPVQGTNLRTTSSTTPTVGLVLRLIGSERPDSILAVAHPSRVPTVGEQTLRSSHSMKQQQTTSSALAAVNPDASSGLHLTKTEERTPPPVPEGSAELPPAPRVKLLKDRVNLPSYDALAQVLPDYEYLFRASSPKEKQKMEKGERQSPVRAPELPETQEPILLPMKRESTTEVNIGNPEITHHEAQELENYRAAMQKMATDIIKLRKDMAWQEAENSKLRSELSLHQNLGPTLLDDADIDVMTKAEIADRIVLLKQKLASETAEHLKSKDKVQQLQNELIRKNDRETELLRLQKAHQQQHAALQKYQEKIRKSKILENTIRQQETIIEKMENILDKKLKERPRERRSVSIKHTGAAEDTVKKEVEVVLLAENARLREELERLRTQPGPIIIQQPVQSIKESLAKSEKLNLLVQLDKAQGRIQTLETLLEENSRKWGREKQSMLTRLSEQEHGLTRTSTMVFHDFPLEVCHWDHPTGLADITRASAAPETCEEL
ncbi:coiled-coil domain-containing protein 33 isoform X2 [Hypanus sabinus]|uniref:coiled-coil domain-containing protein 33 isoform X2 n=1 Tax=Hypanus sabinus TaxID=79690 RepID=UPI0028C4636B|nr:coiled-coil domain-containing protein 33 isoform X2 [Hypanus sabinus]